MCYWLYLGTDECVHLSGSVSVFVFNPHPPLSLLPSFDHPPSLSLRGFQSLRNEQILPFKEIP